MKMECIFFLIGSSDETNEKTIQVYITDRIYMSMNFLIDRTLAATE